MGCDWQSSCKTISDSIGYMYSKGLYTDCSFLVGQGDTTVFKAHKHVLVGVSPVFECMFYGEIPEQANEIHVPDVDPTTFDKFLSAVYSDALELNTFEEACNMFYAANKYMVQKIKDPCLVYIIENINFSNAAEAYELLMLFGQEGAAQDCMKIIQSETSEVVASDGFTSIKKETLLEILKSDSLEIDNELELYNAAVRWIEAEIVRKELKEESDKRALYREILGCIRFLSMNEKDFARGPARECYLSKDETLAVLLNILDPDNPLALPDNFSSEKRKHARNKEKITLFEAAKRGRIDIMAELEEQGEDLKTRENGWSLLHWTAQNGHLEATDWLLKKGLDPSWTNSRGENVLCSAVYSGRLDVVKLVRQSQWQSPTLGLHGSSFSKNTPLAIARDFNLTDIVNSFTMVPVSFGIGSPRIFS